MFGLDLFLWKFEIFIFIESSVNETKVVENQKLLAMVSLIVIANTTVWRYSLTFYLLDIQSSDQDKSFWKSTFFFLFAQNIISL